MLNCGWIITPNQQNNRMPAVESKSIGINPLGHVVASEKKLVEDANEELDALNSLILNTVIIDKRYSEELKEFIKDVSKQSILI